MPTIKRPETDVQRLQALEAAKLKADVTPLADLAFSAANLALLLTFLPNFRLQMQERGIALSAQAEATSLSDKAKAALKKFILHFFQVFNLGVDREEYTAAQRAFFQLDVSHDTVPRLITEQEIAMWAERIVSGDAARVTAGGAAMTNPTAAQVGTKRTAYIAAQGDQTVKKTAYDAEQEDVAALREGADELIHDIWDEVEFTFRKDSPSSKRRKAREYGVVYRPNPGEPLNPDDFSITGKVTDSVSGNAIADVVVLVEETNTIVTTDNDGNYFVPFQVAGSYTIKTFKNGYQNKTTAPVAVVAGQITTINIQMTPGTNVGTVSGHVTKNGVNTQATITVDGTALTTTTDPMGNYSIPNVPEGNQVIRASLIANPANVLTQPVTVSADSDAVADFNF